MGDTTLKNHRMRYSAAYPTGREFGSEHSSLIREFLHFFSATRNSIRGIKDILHETAFRQEVIFGVVHYALIFALNLPFLVKVVLSILWPMVLAMELINSAIEQVVDFISPEWNEFAKHAKDFCSASVAIMVMTTIGVWCAVIAKFFV